jgi:signal transduction histidine kinase
MRLADFIETNTDQILAEWVKFAASSGPAGNTMDLSALRDHAVEMLTTIVADLRTRQTASEQVEKSKGRASTADPGVITAAEVHGAIRAESGFTLGEMVSEYRALRASIIRLWTKACGSLTGDDLGDLMRFNEAIDQSTAESITRFMLDLDRSKEMFIAILGHDLRSPLNAVVMSTQFMLERGALEPADVDLATGALRSARRMNRMVGDLLDFTRSRLGSGVPIVRAEMDLAAAARHAVDEVATANPKSVVRINTSGDLRGSWDAARISQVLANLLGNAVQHGLPSEPITVTVEGEAKDVVLSVHNRGPTIPRSEIPRLFDPVKRLRRGEAPTSDGGNLGLGLYIAERIVIAHAGSIEVDSSNEKGTRFTIRLPR